MNNITDSKINSPAPDRDRKHRETIRVVSNDIGCGGYARPSAFMKYLQDTASMQHEMNPPTTAELRAEMQRAFIMSRISLSIKADLREHDEIDCFAWIAPIKGMSIDRCYEITRGGETVALGAAVWAICDTETKRFVARNRSISASVFDHTAFPPRCHRGYQYGKAGRFASLVGADNTISTTPFTRTCSTLCRKARRAADHRIYYKLSARSAGDYFR